MTAEPRAVPRGGSQPAGSVPPLVPPCGLGALWAVRHGESTANVAFAAAAVSRSTEPVTGRDRDVTLSPLGVRQAEALGGWLVGQDRERGPDLVVCSPYTRAGQTWQVMREFAATQGGPVVEAVVDERLRDRETGVFELHPPTAVRARNPEEADRRRLLGEWHYRPPGGEALTDVALRVRQFLTDLSQAAPGRRVLLVTHDGVLLALRYVLAGIGATAPGHLPPVPNASLSHWHTDGRTLRLHTWGDTAHLAGEAGRD
ncbi:histidine phosphatase family protein [Streptomyces bauhiniae]|uniref:Histidine phosphatase family protein n=1 Tax=Streptomyces bauhiniae TaxID=2340725 RepID=A0A4Z1DB29_9ACTN|nr:histidine phosphatase family protein [Streptomyces bauhiniae]TGN79482.1 histidine phosphatase family protein [Streptomyces bauhiniae]